MPRSPRKTLSKSQPPQPHPHPLKSNSVRASTMRRPTFLRKRSNSVPNLPFANVSAEEAGIIFSAAERAAARRRRPMSEYSPGPSIILAGEHDISLTNQTSPPKADFISSPLPAYPPNDGILRLSTVQETRSSISSACLSVTEMDSLASVSVSSPHATPTVPVEILQPQPVSPRRTAPNNSLKAYADSLFVFTQARLNATAPNLPIDLSLLVPHIKVEDPQPQTPELEESSQPHRPPLVSRFSDWSQTTRETDVESNEPLSRWMSFVHTPEWRSQVHTPDEAGLMTPDSFFAEVTPRVAQSSRWMETCSSSPAGVSRASSPTRGSLRNLSFTSLHFQSRHQSPAPSEPLSYFANFDGHYAAAETQSYLSLEPSPADILRPPSTPGSLLSKQNPIVAARAVSSSASDTNPFSREHHDSPASRQMVDLMMRPPSWLVRASG